MRTLAGDSVWLSTSPDTATRQLMCVLTGLTTTHESVGAVATMVAMTAVGVHMATMERAVVPRLSFPANQSETSQMKSGRTSSIF